MPKENLNVESLSGVHTPKTLDDAVDLRDALSGNLAVAVIGAGPLGAEVAPIARPRSNSVTLSISQSCHCAANSVAKWVRIWPACTILLSPAGTSPLLNDFAAVEAVTGKIHRATVTQADLHHVGSLAIDESLMGAAGLIEGSRLTPAPVERADRRG
jgi:hypothetical protein